MIPERNLKKHEHPVPTAVSYLSTTLHTGVDLLQEVSLAASLGVADGCGVGGLGDEQIWSTLVNPR